MHWARYFIIISIILYPFNSFTNAVSTDTPQSFLSEIRKHFQQFYKLAFDKSEKHFFLVRCTNPTTECDEIELLDLAPLNTQSEKFEINRTIKKPGLNEQIYTRDSDFNFALSRSEVSIDYKNNSLPDRIPKKLWVTQTTKLPSDKNIYFSFLEHPNWLYVFDFEAKEIFSLFDLILKKNPYLYNVKKITLENSPSSKFIDQILMLKINLISGGSDQETFEKKLLKLLESLDPDTSKNLSTDFYTDLCNEFTDITTYEQAIKTLSQVSNIFSEENEKSILPLLNRLKEFTSTNPKTPPPSFDVKTSTIYMLKSSHQKVKIKKTLPNTDAFLAVTVSDEIEASKFMIVKFSDLINLEGTFLEKKFSDTEVILEDKKAKIIGIDSSGTYTVQFLDNNKIEDGKILFPFKTLINTARNNVRVRIINSENKNNIELEFLEGPLKGKKGGGWEETNLASAEGERGGIKAGDTVICTASNDNSRIKIIAIPIKSEGKFVFEYLEGEKINTRESTELKNLALLTGEVDGIKVGDEFINVQKGNVKVKIAAIQRDRKFVLEFLEGQLKGKRGGNWEKTDLKPDLKPIETTGR